MEVSLQSDLYRGRLNPGILEMLDTEGKQLQAIEDLYHILKAQPKYKTAKEPDWKPEDTPITILLWILRRLGTLAAGNPWTIDTWMDCRKTRYRFVIYKHFNRSKFTDDWFFVPLDFLPGLKKRDLPLHDLIIDVIALVNRYNQVPLWDEDGDYSELMSDLIRSRPSSIHQLDQQRLSYTSGPAHEYLRMVRRRVKTANIEDVSKRVKAYDAESARKRSIQWWLRQGIKLARGGENIRPYNYQPHYTESGGAVGPTRYYKFIWTIHESDYVHARAMSLMRDENGSYPPVMFTVAQPGQVIKPLKESDYPIRLCDFMSYGHRHLLSWYREYYFKKQLEETRTPAEVMLENIEKSDIRNLARVRV